MTKFGVVTQVGRSIFLGGQPGPHPNGRGPSFPQNFGAPTYSEKAWRTTAMKFATVTHVGSSVFVGREPRSCPKGRGPSVPQITGTSYMRPHSMRKNNQILHGDQARCDAVFYTVDHECWRAICLR